MNKTMKIDVFDTYTTLQNGDKMHFDVLVPKGSTQEQAKVYARKWLKSLDMPSESIQLDSCRFCHSELAFPEMEQTINAQGFAIWQMEGCPAPTQQ